MGTITLLLLGGAVLYAVTRKKNPVGKLSDRPLDLENILMGVSRGLYTARPEEMENWGYVVWLSGKKADGDMYEDVYPISKETYNALLANGIGKLQKRRIYQEMEAAQKAGIHLGLGNYGGFPQDEEKLEQLGRKFGYKGNPSSSKPYAEQYYNNLNRAYRAISGTTLPYKESKVYNGLGDEIIRYRDYGTEEQQLKDAIDYLSAGAGEKSLYWYIVGLVALGDVKLLWTVDAKERAKGNKGLKEELFGRSASGEKREYRAVLATKEKGGITPDRFAHMLWEHIGDDRLDDLQIRDILLDAVRDYHDRKQAENAIMEQYLDAHQEEDVDYFAPDEQQAVMFDDEDINADDAIPF